MYLECNKLLTWKTNTDQSTDWNYLTACYMGNCIYCGKDAGFFRDHHAECAEKNVEGRDLIRTTTIDALTNGDDLDKLQLSLDAIARSSFILRNEEYRIMISGYDQVVANLCHGDEPISKTDEQKLNSFKDHFDFSIDDLNHNQSYNTLAKSSIIRRLKDKEEFNIVLPEDYSMPIILGKDEKLVFIFQGTSLYEITSKTTYEGQSSGVSIKIMKGLYYRMGQYQGTPITTSELDLVSTGIVFCTNKNLYFSSAIKTIQIHYDNIIGVTPYQDGVSISTGNNSSKPIILKEVDAAFLQNIISTYKNV
jgi:hypothetical protein